MHPPAKRVRLSPEARRAQLIELGVEMLATRTLDELSVELIAQKAGISRGLLFHYFASKREFHVEVARAAAGEMIRRTEPNLAQPPVEALRHALDAFMSYVEENPDNYKSLVRGAASGDAEMRAIFDATRATMAQRIIAVVDQLGFTLSARASLAVHGWVAFVEECVVRWIADNVEPGPGSVGREELLEMLTKSLPAITLAASDGEIGTLVQILTASEELSG
ncbi:TetR/AcrR family transcriptional regulator [uncultured Jatrophihabitans sp.]|uniref:TetR/AcrR family transcriptional regulator n=1 Tax=uncultured Jatrophihabitans sp. TaxID=1610747 RepID=UPI0035C9FFB0